MIGRPPRTTNVIFQPFVREMYIVIMVDIDPLTLAVKSDNEN